MALLIYSFQNLLHVTLLRHYGEHYDKDVATIFRLANEKENEEPHLKMVESRGQLTFDLYINFGIILAKLDLCEVYDSL